MPVSRIDNVTSNYYLPQKPIKKAPKKNAFVAKTEAMLMASLMSLAALADCDIESTSNTKSNITFSDKQEEKSDKMWDYRDREIDAWHVINSCNYGRIREGDTSKGYKKMTILAKKYNPVVFDAPLSIMPMVALGEVYKYNLDEGVTGKLFGSTDQGDALFNRVGMISINGEWRGLYVKIASTELYSAYKDMHMFSHTGAIGYKHNITDKLIGDISFNNDFTHGKGSNGKEYNRSVSGNLTYKISDNANIKMGIKQTYNDNDALDLDYSASFQTTF